MSSRRITLRKRAPEPVSAPEPVAATVVLGKGRPTPKRSEAQRRRGGPVAPPPATRREAARRKRAQAAEDRRDAREGTLAGDPERMLPRDAGPVRALVRDVVDARRNTAVLLLPVAVILLLANVTKEPLVMTVATRLWAATLLAVLVDVVLTVRAIRRGIGAAFPEQTSFRGHIGYGLLRSTVIRRFRMPPPRTAPPPLFRRH